MNKPIKKIIIEYGNYAEAETFEIWNFASELQCKYTIEKNFKPKDKEYSISEEDKKTIISIIETINLEKQEYFEVCDGGITGGLGIDYEDGTSIIKEFDEITDDFYSLYTTIKNILNNSKE